MLSSFVPSISVITVTYNAAALLPVLIESLRKQIDTDFEWIVVDNASSDGTVQLLKESGDVVTKWVSEPDFGIYDAMNKGIKLASGDYYLICGADDQLYPNAISDYRQAAVRTNGEIVSSVVHTTEGMVRPIKGLSWLRGHSAYISHHSVGTLILRSLHNRFGFYSHRFPIAADQLFVMRVCRATEVLLVNEEFVSGSYATSGVSATDIVGTMTDFFRVQLEVSRFPVIQILLFVLRIIRYSPAIIRHYHSN
jgi:glycosyltransferase involved in cell wall biosynthesis